MTEATSWAGRRVLVTGGGGFIGSHLCERFVELGASVRALHEYNSDGSWGWLDDSPVRGDIDVVLGDVRDDDSVDAAVAGNDVVLHLAALIAIPYSYSAPRSYIETNVLGTLNVLRAAQRHGVARIVHTSTSETYGSARSVPIDESHALQAQSPYAASKIAADKLAESFHLSYGLPVSTLRPFNTFGPRQSARAVIPTILSQLIAGRPVALGNLAPTRDFTYVTDTVDAFVRIAVSDEAIGRAINSGSGSEISIAELVERAGTVVGRDVAVEHDIARERPEGSEVERLCADAALARQLLGWQPTVSLDEGLRRTADWIADRLDRYRAGTYIV